MKALLAAAFLALCTGFAVVILAPGVLQDFQNSETFQPAYDLRVETARCKVYAFVISWCTVRYSPAAQDPHKLSVESLMFGTFGGERVGLLRAADGHVTTTTNVSNLANRVFTLIAFAFAGLALVFGGLRKSMQA